MTSQPDWRALHARALVGDAHNDLLCAVAARPPGEWDRHFRERWLPQLRAGGVDLQVLPVFVDTAYRPEGALRRTLRMLECAHRIAEGNPDSVALCRDGQDLKSALSAGRIALVLALEGAPAVADDVELLHTLYRLGVRVASFAHFGRTQFADGSAENATGSKLTQAGVEALHLMQRLGMVFDISHLGDTGVDHALEIASRPVIATHSAARALREHHRNLTDQQIRGVADTGGIVCVNFFAPFLDSATASIDRLADHIEHMVDLVGVAHVGLGPDFVKEVRADLKPAWCEALAVRTVGAPVTYLPELEGPAGLPRLTERLLARGWPEADVLAVLGQSLATLLCAEIGRPAA